MRACLYSTPHLIIALCNGLSQLGVAARVGIAKDLILPQIAALIIGHGKHLLQREGLAIGAAQQFIRRELVLKTRIGHQWLRVTVRKGHVINDWGSRCVIN